MKIKRFRSDWNGCKSDKAYHPTPTIEQIKEALKNKKVIVDNRIIFAEGTVCEVRVRIGNDFAVNTYRDLYSITY